MEIKLTITDKEKLLSSEMVALFDKAAKLPDTDDMEDAIVALYTEGKVGFGVADEMKTCWISLSDSLSKLINSLLNRMGPENTPFRVTAIKSATTEERKKVPLSDGPDGMAKRNKEKAVEITKTVTVLAITLLVEV